MGSLVTSRGLIALLLWCFASLAVAVPQAAFAQCRDDSLELRGPFGTARFSVEIADTAGERAKGLMLRPSMPAAAGMLFVYDRPQHVAFWMKNTLIPLDMVFADGSGRVTRVAANAKVKDLTPIEGGEDIAYVLEINGGLAARMGIAVGAELRSPAMNQPLAAWRCDAP